MLKIRVLRSDDVSAAGLAEIRGLITDAFDGMFSDHDWNHTLGGWHVTAVDHSLLAHAAVVERSIQVGGRQVGAGYVEGVATIPSRQRTGLGSAVMSKIGELLEAEYELGFLSTGLHGFYERLGWKRWQGPTFVRYGSDIVRSAEEDDGIMVLRYGSMADLSLELPICCQARSGDDW